MAKEEDKGHAHAHTHGHVAKKEPLVAQVVPETARAATYGEEAKRFKVHCKGAGGWPDLYVIATTPEEAETCYRKFNGLAPTDPPVTVRELPD
jgi:hypothetical protein